MNALRPWLWKEGRENLPTLLGLTAAYAAVTLVISALRDLETIQVGTVCLTLVVPMLVAVNITFGERRHGTHLFLNVLPVSARKVVAIKWCWGFFAALVPPLVVTGATILLWHPSQSGLKYALPAGSWLYQVAATAALVYAWSLLAGALLRSEREAIAAIVLLAVASIACVAYVSPPYRSLLSAPLPWCALFHSLPAIDLSVSTSTVIIQVITFAVLTPLATLLWIHRQPIPSSRRAATTIVDTRRLRSWRAPIVTKAWRDLQLSMLMLAIPLVLLPPYFIITAVILAAIGLGARLGVTQSVSPDAFWMTRPIPPGRYFWQHALTELLVLFLFLAGPVILVRLFAQFFPPDLVEGVSLEPSMFTAIFFATVPLIYFLSILLGAVTRSRILAASFAAAFAICCSLVAPLLVERSDTPGDLHTATALFFATLFLLILIATLARITFEHPPFLHRPSST